MSAQASVTIPYSEFQAIQDARRDSDLKVVELMEQIRCFKIEASDPLLLVVARAALEVVRYAVASLPAESNKGWPALSLRSIARHLPGMPDATADDQELASTLVYFADEIDLYEKRRRGIDPNAHPGLVTIKANGAVPEATKAISDLSKQELARELTR